MHRKGPAIGRVYPTRERVVTAEQIAAYARAIGDDNPRYRGEDAVAPPLIVVLATLPDALMPAVQDPEVVSDPRLIPYLLHAEEDVAFGAPVRPGDKLITAGRVLAIEQTPAGSAILVGCRVGNQRDELVAKTRSTLFLRDPGQARIEKRDTWHGPAEPEWECEWRVPSEQSARYAAVSGDENPIHLNDEVARSVGLNGRVLHGLCTMAFAVRAVVDQCLKRDSTRLRRVHVRFVRPVYMNDLLSWRGYPLGATEGGATIGFDVSNQEKKFVISGGVAEVV